MSGMIERQLPRRQICKLALMGAGGLWFSRDAAAAKINSTFNGVTVGVHSYSFRDRSLDDGIRAMVDIGVGLCELGVGQVMYGQVSPGPNMREKMREWVRTAPLAEFEAIGRKFRDVGIDPYAYSYGIREEFTDAEIERGFLMAKALGAKVMTSSANLSAVPRIDRFARKYKMRIGMHNHSKIRENEFATPADFAKARQGASDYIAINLDIGHFVAAGFDPVSFIEKHHDNIVAIHIKDRKKNQGPNVPLGEGDTPVREVLLMLRDNHYKFPANIEYEYKGADTVIEVRKCFEYCKKVLLS